METINSEECEVQRRINNRYIRYALFLLFLSDWIKKLLQMVLQLNFTIIFDYLSYAYHLWQLNIAFFTPIAIICLLGIPKFSIILQKCFLMTKTIVKSMIKNPSLIEVPIYMLLFAIIFKFYPFQSKLDDQNKQSTTQFITKNMNWIEIQNDLINYRFFYLISSVLFLFGIYSILTNRLVYRCSKTILSIFMTQMKNLYSILSITIPIPLSWLILFFLNMAPQLFSYVIIRSYHIMINSTFILIILVLVCLYKSYQWLNPDTKYEIDFTGNIYLDDVSQLNKTCVSSIFYPRTVNDIQYLISEARSKNKTISIRGQAHTMGGQTLPSRKRSSTNYVFDLKYMNHVEYDSKNQEVLVQSGATWAHVIHNLNSYGRSPVVMQSYCTFSVAGTISVNAHGITSDDAMYNSVISIEYIDIDGKQQECNREKNQEMFSLIIGGYGLFAIITRLRLMTVPNIKTTLEYIRLQSDQFPTLYEEYLDDTTIEIKIARVDLVRPNNILMFIFRRQLSTIGTVADLDEEARVMQPRQHLIYTYLAQQRLFRRIRFALEKVFARPLDLSLSTDRNTTMYESAKPMAILYQPLTIYNDTFILQEYFIPKPYFQHWYDKLKLIIVEKYNHVFLLNLTIRFVKKDQTTFLSYTKNDDCYAFVFYFRITCNDSGDQQVRELNQKLIQLAFDCHGTFYLPYRQHYTFEQMSKAYPMINEFFEKKLTYDPIELFSNDWYENYQQQTTTTISRTTHMNLLPIEKMDLNTDEPSMVEQRRMRSFHNVITDDVLREKFRKFLHTVFNAEPVYVIFNYVNRAVRNSANQNDHDVYRDLQKSLRTRQFAFIRGIWALAKQIVQLRLQVKDLVRQQITIFKHLGYCGKIKNIVSIGDGGRCINDLRRILKIKDGQVYLINDKQRLADIIERNSLFPIGTFIPYDFKNLTDIPIPSESTDLVVCYMGLHHLPQDQLDLFFKMIYRILRPNGLFLFREHHARKELIPLLDVAHMVFNAVTGVDYESEINEIRAFRTIEQWRSCLRHAGFEDTFVYNEQEDDPTDDIMIVFRKPTQEHQVINADWNENYQKIVANPESNCFRPCEWLIVRICMQFGQYLNHTPFYYFPFVKFLVHFWSLFLTETNLSINKYGLQTTLLRSAGFQMNIFVGIFMTISFLPLIVSSFFVRFFSPRIIPEYEQLIIEQTKEEVDDTVFNFQDSIDHRIDNVQILNKKGFYAIRVPRHHTFTSILTKLAVHSNKFNLHFISSQGGPIQAELLISNNNVQRVLWLKQQASINVIYEYKNPIDSTQINMIIDIKIKELFSFIRDCEKFKLDDSIKIVQIFDYFE
ncbi:unnamed protein product [Rotaria socialis]|uniref:FAD-binding PCMH-type domain-containing protein n=1 Tax=Rotaria socialis TaxID=392032 RepID=A0A817VM97_9BILA|nr:unnamed protein product [Rotaria socialis]CAF4118056.1 unnamed protein product [Rotaria socialis]